MKIYTLNPNPLTRAFLQVVRLAHDQTETPSIEEADIVLTTDMVSLRKEYRPDKFFGFIAVRDFDCEKAKSQPKNVFVMSGENLLGEHENGVVAFKRAFDGWQGTASLKAEAATGKSVPTDIAVLSRSYFVLVVDDMKENLALAMTRLVGQKLILVQGPEEAMRYLNLKGEMPDAVLTDMQMRPDKLYGALNLDQYSVIETIHSGFSVMFEATKRGIPVAIVTDGNHHQDWASAMFDHIKEAEVNGRKVLFFNNIGKRWDWALKALVEP